jgi:hypothetical protein
MKRFFVLAGLLVLAGGVFAGPDSARPVGVVHARVMRDFVLRFDEVSYARWTADNKGSTMYFIKDGFHNRAIYDLKGRWQYSLIFYNESKLPRDIRTAVKRENFDQAITVVEEVQTVDGKAYLVHLEDKSTIKTVKVTTDGEMETIEEFFK